MNQVRKNYLLVQAWDTKVGRFNIFVEEINSNENLVYIMNKLQDRFENYELYINIYNVKKQAYETMERMIVGMADNNIKPDFDHFGIWYYKRK